MPSRYIPAGERGDRKVATFRVRCLGPARKEHTFLTTDPKRNRICDECMERINALAKLHHEGPLPHYERGESYRE